MSKKRTSQMLQETNVAKTDGDSCICKDFETRCNWQQEISTEKFQKASVPSRNILQGKPRKDKREAQDLINPLNDC